ncbi:hypothetical protein E2C01_045687 [Portunus trituberculatus]|uniref:Uncharacterized protein n=1 Tax=Portunus trituberculatus TaxID=210409 RepID=A0A5B7G3N6_PORTR|nr:hypothetical protein [Portunus trituberculatus]
MYALPACLSLHTCPSLSPSSTWHCTLTTPTPPHTNLHHLQPTATAPSSQSPAPSSSHCVSYSACTALFLSTYPLYLPSIPVAQY